MEQSIDRYRMAHLVLSGFIYLLLISKDLAELNRSLRLFEKIFILCWLLSLFQAFFTAKSNTAAINRWLLPAVTGGTSNWCKLHRNASSSSLQVLTIWKILFANCSKIWDKGWQIAPTLKRNPCRERLRRSKVIFFSSIGKECFRGNRCFPEESLGNWILHLCLWTEHSAFGAVLQKNKIWITDNCLKF